MGLNSYRAKAAHLPQKENAYQRVDWATILGLFFGFGFVGIAMALGGGHFSSFIDIPALMIVVGGTCAATTICFSLKEMKNTLKSLSYTLFYKQQDLRKITFNLLKLASIAKQKGPLFLEKELAYYQNNPFLIKGLMMVIDGTSAEKIHDILTHEGEKSVLVHLKSAMVIHKASEFAPAMGLIGTLVGLVQMLTQLKDPAMIGPSMAVAILTTFYGAVLANLLLTPLATKLEHHAGQEEILFQIYITALISMAKFENPRDTELRLSSLLPPEQKIMTI
jgi:chemotaxis protein MotA